ncbi:MAG: Asp-tRNA(Asn)/Glu-tRNA(Gln) amidotransferase subunit GatA [Candidatus Omnitrophica bacterium]|nr:Asp-tRNA(Asn)/Glu-tRNA(Gln) amidotransferase subunit GatA [Candidatus Omnitrophota bacterium]
MNNFCKLSAHELADPTAENKIKAADIASSVISRYDEVDSRVSGFVNFDKGAVTDRAARLDNLDESCRQGFSLPNVPVVLKDNICVKGELTTCASKILQGFKPPYDATVVSRLKSAGVLLLGKSNMDEFAFGSSCETSCYGPTKNPYDLERIPGGSSGGAAALIASDQAILALGSDTGGSIRQPAALCGVVGLKPTYGRVSRYGLIAFGSSLDQIGPITKDVRDCAMLLSVIAGYDKLDSTSADVPVPDYTKSLMGAVKGMRIGLPKEYFIQGLDKGVKAKIDEAISVYKGLGADIRQISLPHTEYAVSCYYIIGCSEASSNMARFDGMQYGYRYQEANKKYALIDMCMRTRGEAFGLEAKRRIILGTYSLSSGYYDAYYLKACKVRALIKADFDKAFNECDMILTPTTPTTAFKIGEKIEDPLAMYLSDIFTIPSNLAGIPAISLPCGYDERGLPIGMQLMARHFEEEKLLRAAYSYEQNAGWKKVKPVL